MLEMRYVRNCAVTVKHVNWFKKFLCFLSMCFLFLQAYVIGITVKCQKFQVISWFLSCGSNQPRLGRADDDDVDF